MGGTGPDAGGNDAATGESRRDARQSCGLFFIRKG